VREEFDPVIFLREFHGETKREDLVAGRSHLQQHLSRGHSLLKALVKHNFDRFINCQNTIDSIHATLKRNEKDMSGGSAGTQNIRLSIEDVRPLPPLRVPPHPTHTKSLNSLDPPRHSLTPYNRTKHRESWLTRLRLIN
jgi:hypothetical protein